jgi:hypothetical protein
MTTKSKLQQQQIDEFEGVVMHGSAARTASHGGANGNRNLPRVVPLSNGTTIAVYPDDATIEVMRSEGWGIVKTGFKRNGNGELSELFMFKSTDGKGILVRFYKQQRPSFHVSMSRYGRAVAMPNAGACTVRRVSDDNGRDAFVFAIADQISIQA